MPSALSAAALPRTSPIHVLVVEDEALLASALEDMLAELGFRVTVARDGREALRAIVRDPPDVMMTDLRLPKVNGMTLIRHIRRRRPGLPIIVLSGCLPDNGEDLIDGSGFKAVLTKPASSGKIIDAFRRAIPLA